MKIRIELKLLNDENFPAARPTVDHTATGLAFH